MSCPPKLLQICLPSYNLKKMDLRNKRDKEEIIIQVLNIGNVKAVKWLFKTYSKREIKRVLLSPERGVWFAKSLNYWQQILGVSIPKALFEKAIINILPQF